MVKENKYEIKRKLRSLGQKFVQWKKKRRKERQIKSNKWGRKDETENSKEKTIKHLENQPCEKKIKRR